MTAAEMNRMVPKSGVRKTAWLAGLQLGTKEEKRRCLDILKSHLEANAMDVNNLDAYLALVGVMCEIDPVAGQALVEKIRESEEAKEKRTRGNGE
jgi:hypothetical protein